MDPLQIFFILVGSIAGGGTVGMFSKALLDRRTGKARNELEERKAEDQRQQAFTDDLLERLHQVENNDGERDRKINALDAEVKQLRKLRNNDKAHINELRDHIWQGLGPPPPDYPLSSPPNE